MELSSILRGVAAVSALAIVGMIVAIVGGNGVVAQSVGWGLIGLAGILAVAGAFYVVGRSEDAERDREAQRRR